MNVNVKLVNRLATVGLESTVARTDRSKRALRTAVKRDKQSRAAELLTGLALVKGRVLDYGCGFGFDADHCGWDAYDPYYRPRDPEGPYDTILCTLVLNVLSRARRARVLAHIQSLLTHDGHAYLAVSRNVPVTGKLGIHHSLQNYVVLTLPLVFADEKLAIYDLRRHSRFEDLTRDHVSRRDQRHSGKR
jgi:hypothetical protein